MQAFGIHLPLPSTWDTDELKLPENNDFTITPKATDSTENLIGRLHNLERRVDYLEQKISS